MSVLDEHFLAGREDRAGKIDRVINEGGPSTSGRYIVESTVELTHIGLETVQQWMILEFPFSASSRRPKEFEDTDDAIYPEGLERIKSRPVHVFQTGIMNVSGETEKPSFYIVKVEADENSETSEDLFFEFDRKKGITQLFDLDRTVEQIVAEAAEEHMIEFGVPMPEGFEFHGHDIPEEISNREGDPETTLELIITELDLISPDQIYKFWHSNLINRAPRAIAS